MQAITIRPSPRYRVKIRWLSWVVIAVNLVVWLIVAIAVSADPEVPNWVAWALLLPALPIAALIVLFIELWISSISYEIGRDEILVHRGILVQTLKVIPFRNVTNIARKRDILDRWFFALGSLEIETAGSTTGGGADAVLTGLDDWDGLYATIMDTLSRFRSRAMLPTAAGQQDSVQGDTQQEILDELKAIRRALEGN